MSKRIKDSVEAWDSGELGREEEFVGVADESHEAALEEALELQAISIRLPKELIRNYKMIAEFHDVGYQPLMRDVLHRFVAPALREILEEQVKAVEARQREREPLVRLRKESLMPLKKAA